MPSDSPIAATPAQSVGSDQVRNRLPLGETVLVMIRREAFEDSSPDEANSADLAAFARAVLLAMARRGDARAAIAWAGVAHRPTVRGAVQPGFVERFGQEGLSCAAPVRQECREE